MHISPSPPSARNPIPPGKVCSLMRRSDLAHSLWAYFPSSSSTTAILILTRSPDFTLPRGGRTSRGESPNRHRTGRYRRPRASSTSYGHQRRSYCSPQQCSACTHRRTIRRDSCTASTCSSLNHLNVVAANCHKLFTHKEDACLELLVSALPLRELLQD